MVIPNQETPFLGDAFHQVGIEAAFDLAIYDIANLDILQPYWCQYMFLATIQ